MGACAPTGDSGNNKSIIGPSSVSASCYVQNRLRAEVLSYGRDLSYEDIQKLEFLDAVVKEGRVYFLIQIQP
jgi:hypothetical protein